MKPEKSSVSQKVKFVGVPDSGNGCTVRGTFATLEGHVPTAGTV